MLDKLKALWASSEPQILALISLAPFAAGVLVGYLLRSPISWALDLIKILLKL